MIQSEYIFLIKNDKINLQILAYSLSKKHLIMKILLLSTNDVAPGAARGAYRLHQGLQSLGIDSQMLVQTKQSNDRKVRGFLNNKSKAEKVVSGVREIADRLPLKFYTHRDASSYSPQWLPDNIDSQVALINPNLINLHWICRGYIQIETLTKFNKPLIWTLRDMWAFTGGCHYDQNCEGYLNSCGACPQLGSSKNCDLSRWVWQRKAKAWKNLDLTIVALSSWLGKCASSSSLFKDVRIEVIPNGLDLHKYRPLNRKVARELLSLPQNKKLVLFGAVNATSDKRKGFHLLQPALQELSKNGWQDKIELVVFGSEKPENPTDFGFKTHYLGRFSDDLSLATVYSAADVFVAPSLQEAFGNTVLEALACSIVCVAFKIGGIPDMIEHQRNGYLAQPYQIDDLAKGITWVLENEQRYQKLAYRAREKVEQEFSLEIPAGRYLSLYQEILNRAKTP